MQQTASNDDRKFEKGVSALPYYNIDFKDIQIVRFQNERGPHYTNWKGFFTSDSKV